MGAIEVEILHAIGGFDVDTSFKSVVPEPDIHI
jgi:hypothetical protein